MYAMVHMHACGNVCVHMYVHVYVCAAYLNIPRRALLGRLAVTMQLDFMDQYVIN